MLRFLFSIFRNVAVLKGLKSDADADADAGAEQMTR